MDCGASAFGGMAGSFLAGGATPMVIFCTKETNLFFTVALMKQSRRSGGKRILHSIIRPVGISRRQG